MTVHFIGAGPGAPDLLTLRGRDLIASCPVCLYAGSLVPAEIIAHAPKDARVIDTAPLTLEQIVEEFKAAHAKGQDVARLHSGDLSVYSAIGEQTRALRELGIPYTITPGVPAFAAAASVLGRELTLPEVSQTLILTRTSGRASAMPEKESLEVLGQSGATLAIHLSIHVIDQVAERLIPQYGDDCPVAVVFRATWPDERILLGTLGNIAAQVAAEPMERTALIIVGRVLDSEDFRCSALYDGSHIRRYRGLGN